MTACQHCGAPVQKHTFAVSILSIPKLLDHLMCEVAAK